MRWSGFGKIILSAPLENNPAPASNQTSGLNRSEAKIDPADAGPEGWSERDLKKQIPVGKSAATPVPQQGSMRSQIKSRIAHPAGEPVLRF